MFWSENCAAHDLWRLDGVTIRTPMQDQHLELRLLLFSERASWYRHSPLIFKFHWVLHTKSSVWYAESCYFMNDFFISFSLSSFLYITIYPNFGSQGQESFNNALCWCGPNPCWLLQGRLCSCRQTRYWIAQWWLWYILKLESILSQARNSSARSYREIHLQGGRLVWLNIRHWR